jgi:tetratricopeptide (TPR) repeat protein
VNRGLCLAEQNSPQAAEGDYSEALKLKLDPGTTAFAYRLRAASRLAQGNAVEAVRDIDAALKLNPQDPTLYEERGFAVFFQKNFSGAVSDFAKALQMNPKLVHLVPWQAVALSRAGMTAEARALLDSASNGKTPPEGWILKLCSFLLDRATEQDLKEAAAASGTPREVSRHTSEANFFAGQKLLLGSEPTPAAERFRAVLAAKEVLLSAYRGACYELGEFAN